MKSWRSEDRRGVLSQYCISNGETALLVRTQNMETWKTRIIIAAPPFDVSGVWAIHNQQSIDSLGRRANARNVIFTTGLTIFLRWLIRSVYQKTSSSLFYILLLSYKVEITRERRVFATGNEGGSPSSFYWLLRYDMTRVLLLKWQQCPTHWRTWSEWLTR